MKAFLRTRVPVRSRLKWNLEVFFFFEEMGKPEYQEKSRAMDTTNKSSEYYGHLFTFAFRVHLLEGSFSVECATLTNRELKQRRF